MRKVSKQKPVVKYILITCCTYKRPHFLDKMLKSLMDLSLPATIKTEILIVDNDKNESAKDVVLRYEKESKIKINYIVEENVGLSNVRNKALKEAIERNASHIAFIDDDEIADKDWILNHIYFYNSQDNIHISSGPTYTKFEKEYPKYIEDNSIFRKSSSKKLGQLRDNCATGNVFIPISIIKETNTYFSEDHNFLGGEDGEFFHRIHDLGYNIGWNCNAICYELVNDERANIRWILNRKYYNGYAGSLLRFKDRKDKKRYTYILEKLLIISLNLILTTFSILTGATNFLNCLSLTSKNIGKLMGAIFSTPINYYQKRGNINE